LTTGSRDGDLVPPTEEDEERDALASQVLLYVAFRRFHALVRDVVARFVTLDETFAKHYEFWEVPPKGLIELVLRAKDTVDDIWGPLQRKRFAVSAIMTMAANAHRKSETSWGPIITLHPIARKLRALRPIQSRT